MKTYIENNRLILEADEGMMLTDGETMFVREYAFPEGVGTNDFIREVTEIECEALKETAEEKARMEMRL